METKLVSIALCTYNGEKYLREQLDSLVNQSYLNIEIIAVDDCSNDETYSILKEYANQFSSIKVLQNNTNLGYIKNFEKAIMLCKGELIALCDQDDIWNCDKIKLQVENIKTSQLIYHDSEFIKQDGSSMNKTLSNVRNFYSGNDNRYFLLENCVSGHSCLFKKELLPFLIPFPDNIYHDWWLAFVACNNGGIKFLKEPLVKYRQHENANTNILRIDRKVAKKKSSLVRIEKEAIRAQIFAHYKYNQYPNFTTKLAKYSSDRLKDFFSFSRVLFLFMNRKPLLHFQKKSNTSKFNFIMKHFWGYQFKKHFSK